MTTIQDIADKMGISKSAVSKALNNAPDISETLRKQVLETAVALGYTKLRRYRNSVRKICVLIEKDNIQYEEPYHFAYDIIMGFRQLAEPQGFDVVIEPVDIQIQRNQPYDVYMLEHDYVGSFVVFLLPIHGLRILKTVVLQLYFMITILQATLPLPMWVLIMTRVWNWRYPILSGRGTEKLHISAILLVLRLSRSDTLLSSVLCANTD